MPLERTPMPLDLTCRLAPFSSSAQLPAPVRRRLATRIAEVYVGACGGQLAMQVVDASGTQFPGTSDAVTATELHEFGLALNRNPIFLGAPRAFGPAVQNIAVILANRYDDFRSAFGVMFDRGFTTLDDRSNTQEYAGVPRESCAIFVDAIDERRGRGRPDGEAFLAELEFTAIHELGHVFNLHHTSEPSYLATSPETQPFGSKALKFIDDHLRALSDCDRDPQVWPGGSDFIQANPDGHLNASRNRGRRLPFGLDLRIDASLREFHYFEPVELDVTLRVAKGIRRTFRVPDCIDPGYSQFRIWIEGPDGERRKLRSPQHYCPSGRELRIAPEEPFCRDIPLFGEAGGYTFQGSGIYRIWVELDASGTTTIRSNVLELNVLPRRSPKHKTSAAHRLLTLENVAKLLYHRVDISNGRLLDKLETAGGEIGAKCPAALWYAIGRARLRQVNREKKARPRPYLVERCTQALQQAGRHEELGAHRLTKLNGILEHLSHEDWQGLRAPRARLE